MLSIFGAVRRMLLFRDLPERTAGRGCCYVVLGIGLKLQVTDQFDLSLPVKQTQQILSHSLTACSYRNTRTLFLALFRTSVHCYCYIISD